MRIVIHNYKKHGDTAILDDVKSIEDNYHDGVTIIFESGRYLCVLNSQYSFIEIQ